MSIKCTVIISPKPASVVPESSHSFETSLAKFELVLIKICSLKVDLKSYL